MTDQLTPEQQAQMDADLKVLLPKGIPTEPPPGQPAGRLKDLDELDHSAKPVRQFGMTLPLVYKKGPDGAHWRWRRYPMGGWVHWSSPAWMQRTDQGQDLEIPMGRHIIAPNWGKCVSHLSDGAFPNGFGSPYAVVYIGAGPFGRKLWYLGHDNADVIPVGAVFHTGRTLARPNHYLNWGRGWSEIGHAANGYPMAMGEGQKWHHLFVPVWKWSAS